MHQHLYEYLIVSFCRFKVATRVLWPLILLFKMLWFWFLPKSLRYFSFGSEAAAILQAKELFLNKQFEIRPED